MTIVFVLVLGSAIFFYSCGNKSPKAEKQQYNQTIREWRKQRLENLKQPDGWLNLAGLYWLKEGKNTLGSDSSHDVVFPSKAPENVGVLHLNDGDLRFNPHEGVKVLHDGTRLTGGKKLRSDATGEATVLSHGPLRWFVIKRGEQYGIRLRDLKSPLLEKLQEIPAFPVKREWKIKARFIPHEKPKTIEVPNVLGGTYEQKSPGRLQFTYEDKQYTLNPTGSKKSLFVVFADETNGLQTYGGGRFLVVEAPGEDHITFLDFNKAYNPPCAFTPYATCPLPPRDNILPFRVLAGEKAPDLEVPHKH
jgi:uncharacterized protein (DUF1684 family)